jgi:hypothetical protein
MLTHTVTPQCLGRYSNRNLLILKQPPALSHLVARRHLHLQLHRHFHFYCGLAHRKLSAQPSDCLPTRVLRTRCYRQRTDEEIRRAVRHRALVTVPTVNKMTGNVPRYRCTENDVQDCTVGRFVTEWARNRKYTKFL